MKVLTAVGWFLIAPGLSLYANEMNASDYADQFYGEWSLPGIPGDDSALSRINHFVKDVPRRLQGEILAQVLDRACSTEPQKAYPVIFEVELTLPHLDSEVKLPTGLDRNLYALTKDPDYVVRINALDSLKEFRRSRDHDAIVAALSDSNDKVRAAAFAALYGRPDADAATYQKFIQDHQSDPGYANSVKYAKEGLDTLGNAQKGCRK